MKRRVTGSLSLLRSSSSTNGQRHRLQLHTLGCRGTRAFSCTTARRVSDHEIARLASLHQHPLSLADLVR